MTTFVKHIKTYLIFVLLIPFSSFTMLYFQPGKSDKLTPVKSIHQTIYTLPKGEKVYDNQYLIFNNKVLYDKKGMVRQTIQYKNDTLFSYTNYYYDTNNLLLKSMEYNSDNTLYLAISFIHDEGGFIIRANYSRTNQKLFDDYRNPVEVEFEKYYHNLFTYVVYKNDFMGNVLEELYYTHDNKLSFKYTYHYDFRYNKTEIKYYNKKGSVSWRKKLKYNKDGLVVQFMLYMNNRPALLSKFKYVYDNSHQWVKRTETRKLYPNFFAYEVKDNTLITLREIEYY